MTEAGTDTALSEADPPVSPKSPADPALETRGREAESPEAEPGIAPETGAATRGTDGDDAPADPGAEDRAGNGSGFEPYDLVFYPQIGHCDVGEVIADSQTGLDLLELTPRETGTPTSTNRILVPVGQLADRGIRRSGSSPGVIEEILGSEFQPTIEDATERLDLITAQEREGTAGSLALALKRLHLRRETNVITREEEKRRVRIRKWLVAEYMAEEEGRTSGQAQSAITRFLARTMKAVREREKEAAREARKRERAERKAEAAAKQARRRGQA